MKVGGSREKVTCSTYVKWQSIPQYIFLCLNILLAILCPPSPARSFSPPFPHPLAQTPLLIPAPLTSWPALWILAPISSCRCAEQFRPLRVLLPNARRCSTHNSIAGHRDPLPQRDNVVIHGTVPSHSIHFPRLGFFNLFKNILHLFHFLPETIQYFCSFSLTFQTNLFAPQMEIL